MSDAFPSLTATTSATTGTSALVLDTADRTDYLRTPKRAVTDGDLSDGDNVYYNVVDKSVTDGDAIFEVGYGAYDDTANTITRTAGNVISGSNGPGVLVSLPGSGTRDVLILDHIPVKSSQITASDALKIAADGNVGIGTSSPVVNLHILDSAANSSPALRLQNDAQTWQLSTVGGAADRFILRDVTGATDVAIVQPGAPANSFVIEATTGNVGIGTASPDGTIHIMSASAGSVTADSLGDDAVIENSGDVGLSLLCPNGDDGAIYFGDVASATAGYIRYRHSVNSFLISADGVSLIIDANGIQIGTGLRTTAPLQFGFSTESLELIDAGSASATEQDWIEVEVNGVQGYIRVFSAK